MDPQAESDDKTAKRIQANRTRAQKAKELHERKTEERRKEASDIKAAYLAVKDSPVLSDILKKARAFAAYHTKIAQDGVGARKTGYKLENGNEEVENYYLTNEKRVSELDKAAGLLELVDYIERQLTEAPATPTVETEAQ